MTRQIADANITALLVQSILLIISQLVLLYICLYYAPHKGARAVGSGDDNGDEVETALSSPGYSRPLGFWQWPTLGSYLEFLAALILLLTILQMALGRFSWCAR